MTWVPRLWIDPLPVQVPPELAGVVGGHSLVAQTLVRRGLRDGGAARGFLDPDHYTPTDPFELPDLEKAVDCLVEAINQSQRILVWGDFDVDGQTATTVLVSTLQNLGAQVDFHIPIRAQESHGVGVPVLAQLLDEIHPKILLTCDTGISNHEAVSYAEERGVTVLISDHHDLPSTLPTAHALINPKRLPEDHPLGTLPGVGVAYKLAEALCTQQVLTSHSTAGCPELLDLVALGIVADLALQQGDTRYLLQRGLNVLRSSPRLGLQIMMEMAELAPKNLSEEHVSFILAPRLNALGRLGDANRIIEFLTTPDATRARILALELEGLNAERQLQTEQVFNAAQAQIEADAHLLDDPILVLSHPTWPGGVIGIVASRLVERYNRPVILFSAAPGEVARGSARSVEGINITAAIAAHQELLTNFGGHPMAAGLGILTENIPSFRQKLARTVANLYGKALPQPELHIDGYLPLTDLSLDLVSDLERLAPFGPGNPPLVLATRGLTLEGYSAVGRREAHLLLTVQDEMGNNQRTIWWQGAGWPLPNEGRFDLAYSVRASTYRGQRDVQVEWIDYRLVEESGISIASRPEIVVVDYRQESYPLPLLQSLLIQEELVIWAEAEGSEKLAKQKIPSADRSSLSRARTLAIWSIPPAPGILKEAIQHVAPEKVYLFGVDPGMDRPEAFLRRLAGLTKYILRANNGQTNLSLLAAATAQRPAAVRAGLTWLEDHGYLCVLRQEGERVWLAQPSAKALARSPATLTIKAMLDESAAFRAYYLRADAQTLVWQGNGAT
ncbi:MAG: single-stranded-DNA-specific exonuclease RecJ [Anaerolineales bacterium]|nr:single-stranded-DNA-specific exonuclease RecJ [Anaerolineales bacterium]